MKKYLNYVISSLVMFIATTTLLGWGIGSRFLAAWSHVTITMKPWSAFGMLIAGFGTILAAISNKHTINGDDTKANVFKGMSSAVFIWLALMQFLLIGEAILLSYNGIKVFKEAGSELTWHVLQQTPSQITISCLLLIAAAHIYEHFMRPIGYLLMGIGSCVLLGYLLHNHELYFDIRGYTTPVAINTAVCYVLLGLSLIGVTNE
jgi:hypothetical protein